MFNTFCWGLNVVRLSWLAAALRRGAFVLLKPWARTWGYASPLEGWQGGIDVPGLGTVAFIDTTGRRTFVW